MMPERAYANSGLLADLYGIMDSDPDFNKEDFLTNAFSASELGGKLYTIFPFFEILSATARTSDVGDSAGWTLDEFAEYINKSDSSYITMFLNSESIWASSQKDFASDMSYKLFVDSVTGELCFDRDIFLKLLEIAGRFPPETVDIIWEIDLSGGTGPDSGGPLIWLDAANGFGTSKFVKTYFGEEIIYKGYPGVSGSGSFFDAPARFAITEQSANKDGAWEFIKYILDEYDFNSRSTFSIKISHLERLAEDAIKNHTLHIGTDGGAAQRTIYGLTEEEIASVLEVIRSTDRVLLYDGVVASIIEAEAMAYLDGQITAEQAADVIESKLKIYFAETS